MFTGIVEEIGIIVAVEKKTNLYTLSLQAHKVAQGTKLGESIAIDGVCLTVTKIQGSRIIFDVMKETLEKTTLGNLTAGVRVNLERALKAGDRMGGHVVTGHADGVAKIVDIRRDKNYIEFQMTVPKGMKKFIVPKGSICLNGVSLTIGKVQKNLFSVYMIPFTMKATNMAEKKADDRLNIEADILARYISK